jgi:uncharacterized membrane protein (UPF0127 family)
MTVNEVFRKQPGSFSFTRLHFWLLLAVPLLLAECSRSPHLAIVGPDGTQRALVAVEIAATPSQREFGLMYRRNLPDDSGMLFVFTRPAHQVFWMHNTPLPLDMIFVGADNRIIGIVADAQPESDRYLSVDGDSLYVLEVNAGFCQRHDIKPGDHLAFGFALPAAS